MSSYATLIALEREYDVKMFIRPHIAEYFGSYFLVENLPRIDTEYPDWKEKNWTHSYP